MTEQKQSPETEKEAVKGHKKDHKDEKQAETGGPKGPEPTRYGDWEIGGKCVDF